MTPRVETQYVGLKGWLVLVGLGLIIRIFTSGASAYENIGLFADGGVELLSSESSVVYIPGYSSLMRLALIGQALLSLFALYTLSLFFLKSRVFPKAFIALLIGTLVFGALDYGAVVLIEEGSEGMQEVLGPVLSESAVALGNTSIASLIWGLYIVKSKRVKATFVQ